MGGTRLALCTDVLKVLVVEVEFNAPLRYGNTGRIYSHICSLSLGTENKHNIHKYSSIKKVQEYLQKGSLIMIDIKTGINKKIKTE